VKDPVAAAVAEEYVSGAGHEADEDWMVTWVPMKWTRTRGKASVLE
jgi:hypothetical protein